ncbi:hypothetical protein Cgig2_027017 [Carnegiea gigantea]|uniref:PB1-like domain-containing protein n=1 Tax=Carnegiea gigantea TaxID=171969 RepID=A0A9Q1JJY3_9CARY|nr:hypothetical protein Cgig2_027017 [Carnegiea gigantea]
MATRQVGDRGHSLHPCPRSAPQAPSVPRSLLHEKALNELINTALAYWDSGGYVCASIAIPRQRMSKKVVLHVYHGGGFPRMPHLLSSEGDISEFECDAEKLSVDNIRDNIVPLGYSKRNIKAIYLSKPNLGFEESLVAINSDIEVNELCLLSSILEYVCLYVKHNNETKSDSDDSDAMVDDDLNEYGLDVDDEEAARIIKKK